MNFMIYIAKAVEDDLKKEKNKSGLINDLLLEHYGKQRSSDIKHYPERREYTAPPHSREVLVAEDGSTATVKKNSVGKPTSFSKGLTTVIDESRIPTSTMRPEPKYCKAGHLLSPTGRCLQKGCKYA